MALHDHAQRVAHQDGVHAGIVHQTGQHGVIGGQHGDLLALGVHLPKAVQGHGLAG